MTVFHQSEITAYARCPMAAKYEMTNARSRQLSATAYGSVMHYALLEVFERQRHTEGVTLEEATEKAVDSFRYFWNPMNITAICEPVTDWIAKQSFNSLLAKGEDSIRAYAELVSYRDEQLLATEYGFQVPIDGTHDPATGEPHILAGTIDRLSIRKWIGNEGIEIGDVKSGKDYTFLRQNLQFTAYAYATTKREFWVGWRGEDGFGEEYGDMLYRRFMNAPRRTAWINLNKMSFQDGGWRGPKDYIRFALAVTELDKAYKADAFPLNISGQTCQYCEFAPICGDVGVADDEHGAPTVRITRRKKATA